MGETNAGNGGNGGNWATAGTNGTAGNLAAGGLGGNPGKAIRLNGHIATMIGTGIIEGAVS